MVIITENRKLEISEVLCHLHGHLLWALAAADGSSPLMKPNKASLVKELQKNVTPAYEIRQPCARLIDGTALVQETGGGQKTFTEVADNLTSLLLPLTEGTGCSSIDAQGKLELDC